MSHPGSIQQHATGRTRWNDHGKLVAQAIAEVGHVGRPRQGIAKFARRRFPLRPFRVLWQQRNRHGIQLHRFLKRKRLFAALYFTPLPDVCTCVIS